MVLKLLKDELTGNPRWGQNVIDKFNLKIFVLVMAFKSRFEVCFILFVDNKYVLYLHHLTVCADKVKHSNIVDVN